MKFSRLFIAVATTTAFSCMALVGCQTQVSTPADMVMRNGYVYTVDGKNSVQQAIAVAGGSISRAGGRVAYGSDWPVWAKAPFGGLEQRPARVAATEQQK